MIRVNYANESGVGRVLIFSSFLIAGSDVELGEWAIV